jgi:hypothetical protein
MDDLNDEERINLRKLIATNEAEDFTQDIREKKHSVLIREDVKNLLELKKKYSRLSSSNPIQFDAMCISKCNFLFNKYTDIYNKVKKDELDLDMLHTLLTTLKEIEDGRTDQHEASVKIGKILKTLYVDSALKKADKLNDHFSHKHKGKKPTKGKKISWSEYKKMQIDEEQ